MTSQLSDQWHNIAAEVETGTYALKTKLDFHFDEEGNRMFYNRPCVDTRAAKIVRQPDSSYSLIVCHNLRFLDSKTKNSIVENIQRDFNEEVRTVTDEILRCILLSWKNQGFVEQRNNGRRISLTVGHP